MDKHIKKIYPGNLKNLFNEFEESMKEDIKTVFTEMVTEISNCGAFVFEECNDYELLNEKFN